MKYYARILLNNGFYGYLEERGRFYWRTKRTAGKHAKEFCEHNSKHGFSYTYIIEAE